MKKLISGVLLFAGISQAISLEELTQAVYKLIVKQKELEKRVERLEKKVRNLEIRGDRNLVKGEVPEKFVVKARALNVRKCPSILCKRIDVIKKGTVVEKLDSYKMWYLVRYEGKEGWIHSKFLERYYQY